MDNGKFRRGTALTVLAVLFGMLAISNALKPFHLGGAQTGLVFFGTKLTGGANAVIAPLFAVFLLAYAAGIWRMRHYALYFAYTYAVYVVINLVLFSMSNPVTATRGDRIFGLVYIAVALGCTWGTAILLTRRRAELS